MIGAIAFDDIVVDGQLFTGADVATSSIDSVFVIRPFSNDVRISAVIDEPIVIAAKDESIQPGIDVTIVHHHPAEVFRLSFQNRWIQIKVKPNREMPDRCSAGNGRYRENSEPVNATWTKLRFDKQHHTRALGTLGLPNA